jgi:hypothetical protein
LVDKSPDPAISSDNGFHPSEGHSHGETGPESEDWDEHRTPFRPKLVLRAESFRPKPLFDTVPSTTWYNGILSPRQSYLYSNRILSAGQSLRLSVNPRQEGTVEFDGEAVIPKLFDLNGEKRKPSMSITPQEIITQRPGILRASGTILVGGLGLGWFVQKVHDRKVIERVILVEKSQELLEWYGHDLRHELPKVTDVICGDVYDQIGRFGTKTKHLLDIWKRYGDCVGDEQFRWHKRRFKQVWVWGQEAEGQGLEYKNGTLVLTG